MSRNFAAVFIISIFLLQLSGCGEVSRTPTPSTKPDSGTPPPAPKPAPAVVLPAPPAPKPAPAPAPTAADPASGPTPPPSFHVWSYLRSFGSEPKGYATYSYVLAGRDQTDALHAKRYSSLVSAIQSSTPSTGDIPRIVPKNLTNLFLIPASRNVDAWNIRLSLSLVTALKPSDKRFQNPGPFIVTLYHPMSFEAVPKITMLFVDLTNVHPDAMPEITTVYKQRISQAPISGFERLKSIKLTLLNSLLITEDRIRFAKAAYADLRVAFVSE